METTKINVKDYFQGMENLYSENSSTLFEVTCYATGIGTNAELVYLEKRLKIWEEEIVKIGLSAVSISLGQVDPHNKALFKAELIARGGLKILSSDLHPIMKEGISNILKKNLALETIKRCPFLEDRKFYASRVRLVSDFYCCREFSEEKKAELFSGERVQKIFGEHNIVLEKISFSDGDAHIKLEYFLLNDTEEKELKLLIDKVFFQLNDNKKYYSSMVIG